MSGYKLECGCSMKLFDSNSKQIDRLPSIEVDYYNINLTCPKAWQIFHSGKTKGVFQLEGGTGVKWCKEIQPSNILEAAAVISLIRPGCISWDTKILVKCKENIKSKTRRVFKRITIKDLYLNKDKYKKIISLNENTYSFFENNIEDVIFSGVKDVYKINFYKQSRNTGKISHYLLKCTLDHKIFTNKGWKTLNELKPGDRFAITKELVLEKRKEFTLPESRDIQWAEFISKEFVEKCEVYDILMEGPHHNFIAGNTVVHNCTRAFLDGKSMTKHYADRKNLKEEAQPLDPAIHDTLSETLQIICYQEQCMQIARDIAGYDLQQADILRKAIGRKNAKLLASLREGFIQGCKTVGKVSEEKAVTIFDNIEKSNRYSFNKCLSLDTIVETLTQSKQIKDVVIGEFVRTPNGFAKILNIYYNGPKLVYRFIFENKTTSIICTMEHKVKTSLGMRPIGNALIKQLPIETVNGFLKITDLIELGEQETIDIEVDSSEHIFYGNDVVVSNSHAVEYSLIGYWTAWAKAHFPLHFYTAWLSYADQKMDYETEVSDLVQDARSHGIHVLNPSIDRIHKEFKIENNNIRFGFGLVKSLGESAFHKFKNTLENISDVENFAYEEFLFKVSPLLNKTVMYNITYVGALDKFLIDRNKILFDYDIILKLTDKELQQIITLTNCKLSLRQSLQKLISEGKVSTTRKAKISDLLLTIDAPGSILKDTPALKSNWEVEFLGIALSSSPLESCRSIGDTTCEEFVNGKIGESKIAGEILDCREYIIKEGKNAGKEMAFIKLKDLTGIVDCVVFSEVYNKYRNILIKGNTLLVVGNRSPQESLVINKVTQI